MKEFVESKPEKEFTKMGDIAREMFRKVEILVLDEATSSLDSATELFIQENIEKLHRHYTIIVLLIAFLPLRTLTTFTYSTKEESWVPAT